MCWLGKESDWSGRRGVDEISRVTKKSAGNWGFRRTNCHDRAETSALEGPVPERVVGRGSGAGLPRRQGLNEEDLALMRWRTKCAWRIQLRRGRRCQDLLRLKRGSRSRASACSARDGSWGWRGASLSEAERAGRSGPTTYVSAGRFGDRASQPALVSRHHVRADARRVHVSNGHSGLSRGGGTGIRGKCLAGMCPTHWARTAAFRLWRWRRRTPARVRRS